MSVTTGFPFNIGPLNNIQPFTYRDQTSHMAMLEKLRVYINDSMRPEFNEEMQRIIDEFQAGITNAENTITNAQGGWQTAFDNFMEDVVAQIATLNDDAFASLIDSLTSDVHTSLLSLFDSRLATTKDSVVSGLIAMDSLTRQALDARMATNITPQIEDIAAAYIASTPAIVDAAVAAVDAAPAIAGLQAAQWNRGVLANGTNLGALNTTGTWYSGNSANVTSIIDRPTDSSATSPFRIDVTALSTLNGSYHQLMTQWTASGPQQWERVGLSSVYQAWTTIETNAGIAAIKANKWDKGALALNATLATLTSPGSWYANTSVISASILDRPIEMTNQPFRIEVVPVSAANGINEQFIEQWTADGLKRWSRLSLSNVYSTWKQERQNFKWSFRAPVHCFGDSLSEVGFPNYLGAVIGATVVNRGKSGDTSNDVLLRAGVIQFHALPVGGSIPASGGVNLDTLGRKLTTRDGRAISVVWNNIAGTLTHSTGDAWTFTRTTAGTAVPMTTPMQMVSVQELPDVVTPIYWFGTNDAWFNGYSPETSTTKHIKANYKRAVDSMKNDGEKRGLILGMVTSLSTTVGSALWNQVQEVNSFCESIAPHLHIDVQSYMVNQCLTDLGLTPTTADTNAMANGLIPPQLYVDDLHFTQNAQQKLAENVIGPSLKARGWA